MMSKRLKNIAFLVLSLAAVSVTAVSTFAWFQLTHVSISESSEGIVSGSTGITVGDVYGYKSVRQRDENGYLAINGDSVTKKKSDSESTTNTGSSEVNANFNIPLEGDGYYLCKESSTTAGVFLYEDGYRFDSYISSGLHTLVLDDITLTHGDTYRMLHYGNNGVATINGKVSIYSVDGVLAEASDGDLVIGGSDITNKKVWYNSVTGAIGFETLPASDYKSKNHLAGPGVRNKLPTSAVADGNRRIYCTNRVGWSRIYCHTNTTVWPGTQMTFAYYNEDGDEVYYIDIPDDTTMIVFNQNYGGNDNQTADITNLSTNGYCVLADKDEWQSYKRKHSTWTMTTATYYLYNKLGSTSNYFGSTPYFHTWTNNGADNHGTYRSSDNTDYAMDHVSGDIWKVTLPYYHKRYIVFGKASGENQAFSTPKTVALTAVDTSSSVDNADAYFFPTGGSGSSVTGSWYSTLLDSTEKTYHLVDFQELITTGNTAPNAHLWLSSGTTLPYDEYPGRAMTQPTAGTRIFSFTASTTYDMADFNGGYDINNTVDIALPNTSASAAYYEVMSVIGDGSNAGRRTGRWTKGEARTASTKTIYLYDPLNWLNGATPKLWAWDDDGGNDGTDLYYSKRSDVNPGMDPDSTKQITASYYSGGSQTATIYAFTFSSDYTNGFFNKGSLGNNNQTCDITFENGRVYEINNVGSVSQVAGGTWRDFPDSVNTRTIHVYDYGGFGSAPYLYARKNNNSIIDFPPYQGVAPDSSATVGSYTKYTYTLSSSFDRIQLSNAANTKRTSELAITSSHNGKTLVLTSVGAGYQTGGWFSTISPLSGATQKVYLLDGEGYFGNDPKVYATSSPSLVPGPSAINGTFYYPYETATAGVSMSALSYEPDGSTPTPVANGYYYDCPVEYTRITFKGNSRASAAKTYDDSVPYFVTTDVAGSIVNGTWAPGINSVTERTCYYLKSATGVYTQLTTSMFASKTIKISRGLVPNAEYNPTDDEDIDIEMICDDANDIIYYFEPEEGWYNGSGVNATTYATPGTVSALATTIYKRMVCYEADMRELYVDYSRAYAGAISWHEANVYAWVTSDSSINNMKPFEVGDTCNDYTFVENDPGLGSPNYYSNFLLDNQVGPKIRKFTVNKYISFRLNWYEHAHTDGGDPHGGVYSQTTDTTDLSALPSDSPSLMYLITQTELTQFNNRAFDTYRDVEIGTAKIKVNGAYRATMQTGDITHNYFLLESGVDLNAGDYFTIEVEDPDTVTAPRLVDASSHAASPYVFDSTNLSIGEHGQDGELDAVHYDGAPYILQDGDTGYDSSKIQITITGTYTIYLTSSGDIQVCCVPRLGNGYYIMQYKGTTNTYANASKMTPNESNERAWDGAYYNTYTVHADVNYADAIGDTENASETKDAGQIFLRSYLDGEDHLYTNLVANSKEGVVASQSGGVITIKAGVYNIRVDDDTVYIIGVTKDDHFSIDPLVSGHSIEDNFTSIVFEVEFTSKNTGPINIGVDVEGLPSYLGVAVYASTTPITTYHGEEKEAAPYLYMREHYLSSLSSSSSVVNTSVTLPANAGSTKYYAYILLDYVATNGTQITSYYNSSMHFYLKCVQA